MRPWVTNPDELKVPRRSQTIGSWCLPMLSKSIEAGEREGDAIALFNSVKNMAARKKESDNG